MLYGCANDVNSIQSERTLNSLKWIVSWIPQLINISCAGQLDLIDTLKWIVPWILQLINICYADQLDLIDTLKWIVVCSFTLNHLMFILCMSPTLMPLVYSGEKIE